MSLKTSIEKVIFEYPTVSRNNFKGHEFANHIRNTVPKSLHTYLELPDIYNIRASVGNGSWAKVPWIAIFNRLVTESVTSGFYCVYLFCADCSGVYLSLNQGIADKRDKYGLGESREILRSQANHFRNAIDLRQIESFSGSMDLKLDAIPKETTSRRLGLAYEAGNIVSKFYSRDLIPEDNILISDLRKLLEIYFILFEKSLLNSENQTFKTEENEWFEDLTKYRIHRVAERNQTLSKRVKQLQGFTCKVCNFNFETRYGEIGKNYIEAHHIVPISSLNRTKIQLDPIQDFTVLCSNCHRMIHRIKPVPSVEEFKKILKDVR
jgi:5-methylcytosine-specific restriction protein A